MIKKNTLNRRSKTSTVSSEKSLRKTSNSRRKALPKKLRKNKEKRQDMQIIVSASQGDIYTWAISMVIMVAVLVAFIVSSILIEGN